MEYVRFEKDDYGLWDDFVEDNYSGTIFHKTQWLKNTDLEFEVYAALENNKILGGAVFSYDSIFRKRIYQQPVLTPYSGFVLADSILKLKNTNRYSNVKKIKREIFRLCKMKCGKVNYSPYLDIDIHIEKWNGFSNNIGHIYILPLKDINEIYNNFHRKRIKLMINKAAKDDTIVTEESKDIEIVINLVKLTYQRQGMRLNIYSTLRKLDNNCNSKAFICIDKRDNKSLACAYIVYDSKRAYGLVTGYDYKNAKGYGTTLCLWETIKAAFNLGLKQYDFTGTMLENVDGQLSAFGGNLVSYAVVSKKIPYYYVNRAMRRFIFLK